MEAAQQGKNPWWWSIRSKHVGWFFNKRVLSDFSIT